MTVLPEQLGNVLARFVEALGRNPEIEVQTIRVEYPDGQPIHVVVVTDAAWIEVQERLREAGYLRIPARTQ